MNDKVYHIEMIDNNGDIDYSSVVFESEIQAYKQAKKMFSTGKYKGFYIREIYIVKSETL